MENIWNSLSESQEIVVFDLETSGMNCEEDFIIEIGAVKVRGGKVIDEFHSFVACPQPLSKEIEQLTGIKNKDIASAPFVKEVLENFYSFADGCFLASYNLSFDWNFIKHAADLYGLKFANHRIDILPLVQEKLQGQISTYKLSIIAAHYGIETNQHSVLDAVKIAAEILLKLI